MCVKWIFSQDFLRDPLYYQKILFDDKNNYVCLAKHFCCTLNKMSFSSARVLGWTCTNVWKYDFIFIRICYEQSLKCFSQAAGFPIQSALFLVYPLASSICSQGFLQSQITASEMQCPSLVSDVFIRLDVGLNKNWLILFNKVVTCISIQTHPPGPAVVLSSGSLTWRRVLLWWFDILSHMIGSYWINSQPVPVLKTLKSVLFFKN